MKTEEMIFLFITVFLSGASFGAVTTSIVMKINESKEIKFMKKMKEDEREEFEWDVGLYSDEWLNRDKETDDE